MKPLLVSLIVIFLAACTVQQPDEQSNESTEEQHKPKLNCSASPPILDKSKITEMLRNNGTLQSDMNQEEVEKIVNDYITRKNNNNKACTKK